MSPNELSNLFRSDVQDEVEPFLWTDDDVYRYIDDAQIEFARRTDYFLDRTTFGTQQVAVTGTQSGTPTLTFADADPDTITRSAGSWVTDGFVAGMALTVTGTVSNNGTYTAATVTALVLTLVAADALAAEAVASTVAGTLADPGILTITNANRILRIIRGKLTSRSRPLILRTIEQVDREGVLGDDYGLKNASNWETTSGPPVILITNWERNKVRLVPEPTANDTLNLMVYRRPLNTVTVASTVLEIDEVEHQRALASWMKFLAYNKQDADTYSEALSEKFFSNFVNYAVQVKSDLRRQHRVAGATVYGGL